MSRLIGKGAERVAEEIAKLKQQPGRDLLLFGSANLAVALVARALISINAPRDQNWGT